MKAWRLVVSILHGVRRRFFSGNIDAIREDLTLISVHKLHMSRFTQVL